MGQGISGHDSNHGMPSGGGNGKITDTQNGGSGKNKFADKNRWPTDLELGDHGKHVVGHNNYKPGNSILTISTEETRLLAARYAGKGQVVGNNKEWVDFGKIIGFYVDKEGNKLPTTKGMIHHSDRGVHIVPSHPEGEY